ncbi:dienelactone hydrolase family protein [Paenibacillus tarimensis]|uniref:dienelactone hydrolase family protein n=1 Tax=Paenibacillus tarimensis TaxID=416012 RepID=UPI001F2AD42A|nr:dienelactone hydrolase family protein [Paenibacillus tarimensis]MCF2944059.1 dienelactone hydrolase family protein [Paenibacillus tarimensis]
MQDNKRRAAEQEGTGWAPDLALERLIERLEEERKVKASVRTREQRRAELLASLQRILGDFDDLAEEGGPLAPRLLERIETAGMIRERVEFTAGYGLRVPAYAVWSKTSGGGRLPAVLALHGHGSGSRDMLGLSPDGTPKPDGPGIHGDTVEALSQRGFFVLVPDIAGFGDRKLMRDAGRSDPSANSCFGLASALLMTGRTLAGLRVFEARRALDYLDTRDDVDAARVGCIGFSGGGMVASLTTAVENRIRAAVICGYGSTYRGSILAMQHCLDNYLPGILREAEMPELLGLIAPRPLLLESGRSDHLFPVEEVQAAADYLVELYAELGAADCFRLDLFEGGHEIRGGLSFDWLQTKVKEERGHA